AMRPLHLSGWGTHCCCPLQLRPARALPKQSAQLRAQSVCPALHKIPAACERGYVHFLQVLLFPSSNRRPGYAQSEEGGGYQKIGWIEDSKKIPETLARLHPHHLEQSLPAILCLPELPKLRSARRRVQPNAGLPRTRLTGYSTVTAVPARFLFHP